MFTKANIQVVDKVKNWEEAIQIAAKPLLMDGSIQSSYVDAMIESIHDLGFYVVLDDGLAMPHARPESGVNRGGVAFLKVNEPVDFGGQDVQLLFVLAAEDDDNHIERLMQLMEIFQNQSMMKDLKEADNLISLQNILIGG